MCSASSFRCELHQRARARLKRYSNVKLIQGDSAALLPDLLAGLSEPAGFWLDAHFSGGETARGDVDTPVVSELRAILGHPMRRHVILIDDARLFTGGDGYPCVDESSPWYGALAATQVKSQRISFVSRHTLLRGKDDGVSRAVD